MAKQKLDNSQHTVEEKIKHYSGRVNDPTLTEGQRKHAAKRLGELCGGGQAPQTRAPKSPAKLTSQQQNAHMAGIGYGAAKAGARVPVQPQNQDDFRDGVKVGRALAKKQNQPF